MQRERWAGARGEAGRSVLCGGSGLRQRFEPDEDGGGEGDATVGVGVVRGEVVGGDVFVVAGAKRLGEDVV